MQVGVRKWQAEHPPGHNDTNVGPKNSSVGTLGSTMAGTQPGAWLRSECTHRLAALVLLPLTTVAGPAKGGRVVAGVPSIEEWDLEVWPWWVSEPISSVSLTPLTLFPVFLPVDLSIATAVWELREHPQALACPFWNGQTKKISCMVDIGADVTVISGGTWPAHWPTEACPLAILGVGDHQEVPQFNVTACDSSETLSRV